MYGRTNFSSTRSGCCGEGGGLLLGQALALESSRQPDELAHRGMGARPERHQRWRGQRKRFVLRVSAQVLHHVRRSQVLGHVERGTDIHSYRHLTPSAVDLGCLTQSLCATQAYQSILQYIKNDHWYIDVDMDTGRPSRNWVDTFQAFFPSLMVRPDVPHFRTQRLATRLTPLNTLRCSLVMLRMPRTCSQPTTVCGSIMGSFPRCTSIAPRSFTRATTRSDQSFPRARGSNSSSRLSKAAPSLTPYRVQVSLLCDQRRILYAGGQGDCGEPAATLPR